MTSGDENLIIKQRFAERFGSGGRLHVVRAPGRVNLIGEHTDYNDGFVLPLAIEPDIRIVCRARADGIVRLASSAPEFKDQVSEFSVQEKISPADVKRGEFAWSNYSRGVAAELKAAGIPIIGMDALVSETLPPGGGLSSSAALEVGTALALLALEDETIDPMRLALICQRAEHEYAGAPVGLMDPMIVATARAGHATLFDCRSHTRTYIPLSTNDVRLLIANTMVRHDLSTGEYRVRREQCQQAVEFFRKDHPEIKALRDVTAQQVQEAEGRLDDVLHRRARHVVLENQRTTECATALKAQDYDRAGELMLQSHQSLRVDYEVSTAELDFMVEQATGFKGVYGARMTGGGFGGCIIALAQPRCVEALSAHLVKTYQARFNILPTVFITAATDAAHVVE